MSHKFVNLIQCLKRKKDGQVNHMETMKLPCFQQTKMIN